MIGVVIVTHGSLAQALIEAAHAVVGHQQYVEAIQIDPQQSDEVQRENIRQAVSRSETGDGVMILTDMFGGTPSNLAISMLSKGNIEVVAGVNLPMLIRLFSIRKDTSLSLAAIAVQEAGRKYINVASTLLNGRNDEDGALAMKQAGN